MLAVDGGVIVAGHICLDVIPDLGPAVLSQVLEPGCLVNVGKAVTTTGGCVSNTGIALHKLGVPTRLMGKVGDDLFGRGILDALRQHDAGLADSMIISEGAQTSYSIVISPEGSDRIFLHHSGANDTFAASDVELGLLASARLFHFGYPPLMQKMYREEGKELAAMLSGVKEHGLTISLDMSRPDLHSEAGSVHWGRILVKTLPYVDIFMPSVEEIMWMLRRKQMEEWSETGQGWEAYVHADLLRELSGELLDLGAAVIGIKLGDQGLYVRTTGDLARLTRLGKCNLTDPERWVDRELLAPCFQVVVKGTTGAGDCTIAGFLSGLICKQSLEKVMTTAVGVGACNVEAMDATSGIPGLYEVLLRISKGWDRLPVSISLPAWYWDETASLWRSPKDRKRDIPSGLTEDQVTG